MEEPGYERSPVPADADLWPGERPFTAWGQHNRGTLDLRVFDQDVWWVDIAQVPHRLVEDMSLAYVSTVIAFLEEHVEMYYTDTLLGAAVQTFGDLLLERVPVELVAAAAGAPPLRALTPTEWLEATPLKRKLRRLAAGGDA